MKPAVWAFILCSCAIALQACQSLPNPFHWPSAPAPAMVIENATEEEPVSSPFVALITPEDDSGRLSALQADNTRLKTELARALKENAKLKKDLSDAIDDNSLLKDLAARKQR